MPVPGLTRPSATRTQNLLGLWTGTFLQRFHPAQGGEERHGLDGRNQSFIIHTQSPLTDGCPSCKARHARRSILLSGENGQGQSRGRTGSMPIVAASMAWRYAGRGPLAQCSPPFSLHLLCVYEGETEPVLPAFSTVHVAAYPPDPLEFHPCSSPEWHSCFRAFPLSASPVPPWPRPANHSPQPHLLASSETRGAGTLARIPAAGTWTLVPPSS